jgi:sodium transport system permease protein
MKAWLVVLLKELLDASRDKRVIVSLLIFPVIGPLMIMFMFNMLIDLGEEAQDVELAVAGIENAPDLVDYLRQNGVTVRSLDLAGDATDSFSPQRSEEIATAIAARNFDFALLIPADFGALLAAGKTVNVELHLDSSRNTAAPRIARVQGLIDAWGRETAVLRLLARGINSELVRPVNVSRIDTASAQARAQAVLGMIPLFVIMAAFMSGVGIAVDTTAGERERKSLEPLLVNPVPRFHIVLGKWLAATLFSVSGLLLVMMLNLLALSRVPLEEIGLAFLIGPREIAGMLLVTIPLGFFATSLQMLVGNFAKSFKDAQVYIQLMSMLPMLPYFYNIFNSTGREPWMNLVPMLAQNMLLTDVVSGRMPSFTDFGIAAGILLVWSGLLISLATRLLSRERVIFS